MLSCSSPHFPQRAERQVRWTDLEGHKRIPQLLVKLHQRVYLFHQPADLPHLRKLERKP